jgi:spore cortex formation protein SpoVR/YcgB (stage V sporulation)
VYCEANTKAARFATTISGRGSRGLRDCRRRDCEGGWNQAMEHLLIWIVKAVAFMVVMFLVLARYPNAFNAIEPLRLIDAFMKGLKKDNEHWAWKKKMHEQDRQDRKAGRIT